MDIQTNLLGIRSAFIVMAIVLVIEALIPLYARTRWHWRHLVPNLSLALVTFALGTFLNLALLAGLLWLGHAKLGLFNNIAPVSPFIEIPVVLLALDFS
jgi:hypothetical protein